MFTEFAGSVKKRNSLWFDFLGDIPENNNDQVFPRFLFLRRNSLCCLSAQRAAHLIPSRALKEPLGQLESITN